MSEDIVASRNPRNLKTKAPCEVNHIVERNIVQSALRQASKEPPSVHLYTIEHLKYYPL